MSKPDKISLLPLFIFALCCVFSVKAQSSADSAPPQAQNFHQWGAVTLFNGLPSDKVRAVAQTPDGVLWFGTDSGLSRFDGRRIQTINLNNGEAPKISALETSADGTLWIGAQSNLIRYRNGKFQIIEETRNFGINALLLGENIYLATDRGYILKLNETGENSFKVEKFPGSALTGGDGQALKITSLSRIDDKMIAGTRGRSILIVENNQASEIFSRPRPFFVNALERDKKGRIWLGADSVNSGLYLLETIARPQKIGEAAGNVLSVKPDNAEGVWVGTETRGLFHFRGGEEIEHFTFENSAGGLRSNTIYALFVDREGVVWIGTNRGVCRFDPASPQNKILSENANGNFVRTFYKSADEKIFAGTNRGLFLFSGGNWIEIKNLSQKAIYAVGENAPGQLLIAAPNGLYGFDGKQKLPGDVRAIAGFQGKTFIAVFGRGVLELNTQTQIFSDDASTALYADEQNLWIGTARNGVFRFDGKSVKQESPLENSRGAAIRKISKDAENNVWFAGDGGLFLYKNGRLENIISNQIVWDFIVNGADVWAATEGAGLLHLKRDERFGWLTTSLNIEQGLPSQKIFSILPVENRFLIGTNRGAATYEPSLIPPKIIPARVLSQRLHSAEELNLTISLGYPQNSILVEVAGLSSRTFPEQFLYGFLLLNSKNEVLDKRISNDSQFAPANLPPGEYRIEASAYNKDLLASEPLTIRFSVAAAPFPRTAAALGVLLAVALIALVWAIIERRRLAERNRQLAAARFDLANEAERERKRIAGDLHDQTLADLRNLMMMSDKIPADTSHFRSEVEAISTEIRRICEDLSPSALENVGLAAALEFLLKHTTENSAFFADDRLEEQLKFSLNAQMQIYRIAQEVLTNIKHHSDAKFVEMKIDVSETGDFVLKIKDDGSAFNPVRKTRNGRGIANIKSRAALINAEISWREAENGGGGNLFSLKKKI